MLDSGNDMHIIINPNYLCFVFMEIVWTENLWKNYKKSLVSCIIGNIFVRYLHGPNCTVAHFLPYKLQHKKLPKDLKMISKMIQMGGETVKHFLLGFEFINIVKIFLTYILP
jgi:hypothetical protein